MYAHTRRFGLVLSGGLTIVLGMALPAGVADTIYVDDNAPLGGDGSSWSTPFRYLQDALAVSTDGDEIRVAGGAYQPDQDEAGNVTLGDREATFQLISGVGLYGGYRGSTGGGDPNDRDITVFESVLSGDLARNDGPDFQGYDENSYHITEGSHTGPTTELDGFTVTGGNADGGCCEFDEGGGLRMLWGSPTIKDCAFIGNVAGRDGGGVVSGGGDPMFVRVVFIGNAAGSSGGAVNCHSNGYPSFIACLFASNAAFVGGAIDGGGGGFVMDHCEFNYNRAEEDGRGEGGAVAWSGTGGTVHTRHITNCRFVGNTSQIGGAVFFDGGEPPTICNSTFADNVAFMYGGAAACLNPAYMVNCTFSRNSAWEAWGAVYDQHPNDTVLVNCIVYQSLPEDESIGPFGAVAVRYSCVTGGYDGIGNTDADPLFVDPDGNDYHLTAGSPCIDSGCNGAVPEDFTDLDQDGDTAEITPLDLDGEGRFFDDPDTPDSGCGIAPIVDMGAYEFGDAGAQPCPGDLDGDRDVDQSDLGILLSLWGSSDACDLDCDGDVDQGDLGILLAHWGQSCP